MSIASIIGFIVIGFMLLFFELFLPGAIIGMIGAVLIGVGVYGTFQAFGPAWGIPVTLLCSFGIIGFIVWWARYFPESRMGGIFNLRTEISRASGYVSQDAAESQLLGKRGVTVTTLRPSGEAEIDGRRVDVISDGGYVEKGVTIQVIEVASNRIVVGVPDTSLPGEANLS
ncbi:MAG: hypothetical protein KC994_00835 [Candidatus Omnitrophica bacterium]|nr:hypothetical protein [Candidatus Omnitrophota bacterium]